MKRNKILALVGSGQGPLVSAREFTEPVVRVLGLVADGFVSVTSPDGPIERLLTEDGDYPVPPAKLLQLFSSAGNKNLLCFIVGR